MMEKALFSAHFQLTGRCNLSCRFCGQSKGMLAASAADDLPVELWLRVAAELKKEAEAAGRRPEIMLWGGEPLLYEAFDELAERLHAQGFTLGIVTNGTLIDQHAGVLCRAIDAIHISVDGIGEEHDRVRGEGVFAKLKANLPLLEKRRGRLIFLTTVSDNNVGRAATLPRELAALRPDRIVFQQLMYLTHAEIEAYRAYSRAHFGCDYPQLGAWERADDRDYLEKLEAWRQVQSNCPVPCDLVEHAYPLHRNEDCPHCDAAWSRVHVRLDGEVGFCTDYFGFSAGNVRESSLHDLFYGARAELFRDAVEHGALAGCCHCPWRLQHEFGFRVR